MSALSNNQRPKLRPLDPQPLVYQGQASLLLRDPLRLAQDALIVPQYLAPLLLLCDGERDIPTIAAILDQHFRLPVRPDTIRQFIQMCDQMCLLDNQRAAEAQRNALETYRNADFRTPALAGDAYPADPAQLHRLLNDHLEAAEVDPGPNAARGLLSPHIDYPRGGHIYARVWKHAAPALQHADLIVILGTDHYGGHNPITLTRQHYATPFGVLPTDQEVVDALAAATGEENAFAGELYHRHEHSIELVAVWLHHLLNHKAIPLVPILVGQLPDPSGENGAAARPHLADALVAALRQATAGRRVFYVVSGDLAHVGPAFGGRPLDENTKHRIAAEDQRLFDHLAAGDAQGFLHTILSEDDKNNVCGTFPLYLAMRMMGTTRGKTIGYAQCPADNHNTSIVTIGGVVFE